MRDDAANLNMRDTEGYLTAIAIMGQRPSVHGVVVAEKRPDELSIEQCLHSALNDAGAFETSDAKTKTRENKGHHPAVAATTLPALVGEMKEEGSKSVPHLIDWTTMAYN